jgi:hypothetical protein
MCGQNHSKVKPVLQLAREASMANYIVSYDLHKQRNYQPLWNALASLGAVRLLESLWLLRSTSNVDVVIQSLRRHIDGDDSIVVIELKSGSGWMTFNARPAGNKWLSNNINRNTIAA